MWARLWKNVEESFKCGHDFQNLTSSSLSTEIVSREVASRERQRDKQTLSKVKHNILGGSNDHTLGQGVLRATAKVNVIQWKRWNLTPNCPPNPQTDGHQILHGWWGRGPLSCAKFYYYPIRGFRSPPPPLPCYVGRVQSDSASLFLWVFIFSSS